jgi:hypothetical protein
MIWHLPLSEVRTLACQRKAHNAVNACQAPRAGYDVSVS